MLTHMFVEDPKSIGRLRVGGFKRSRGQNSAPTPNWNNCVILAGKSLRARSLRARSDLFVRDCIYFKAKARGAVGFFPTVPPPRDRRL